jgi:hypothetical protein
VASLSEPAASHASNPRQPTDADFDSDLQRAPITVPPAPTSKLDCPTIFEEIRQTFAARRAALTALYAEMKKSAEDSISLKSALSWWMNGLNALHAEEAKATQAAAEACMDSGTRLPR